MKELNRKTVATTPRPVRIMQFGEGNFLRAFVDWMVDRANKQGVLNAGIVVVQPLARGMVDALKAQDNLYHVYLEGIKDKKMVKDITLVESIQDALDPYTEFEKYERYVRSEELEFIVSNTTEAGITYHDDEDIFAKPARSFPGKVAALLHSRFEHFKGDPARGLTFFCCELIENNAATLKDYVLRHAERRGLGADFAGWVKIACRFCDTSVDRIVPGFPRENIDEIKEEIGFNDNLVVKGEYYHVWAIAGGRDVHSRFPLDQAGLHVLFLDDLKSFRDKKVRILNGAHIALNSLSKWETRNFPTLKDGFSRLRMVPPLTAFSLAALLALYSGRSEIEFAPNDTPGHVKFFRQAWDPDDIKASVERILSNRAIWKEDLMAVAPLTSVVAGFVQSMLSVGMRRSLEAALSSDRA
jgi:tagaturonate reductase